MSFISHYLLYDTLVDLVRVFEGAFGSVGREGGDNGAGTGRRFFKLAKLDREKVEEFG